MRVKTFLFALLLVVSVMFSACSSNGNGDGNDLEIKLAPIHELDVRFAESYPIQVFLYVKGGLSDGCTTFHGIEIKSRSGNSIKVEVTVERPKDKFCPAVYTYFEQNLNLGTDFKSGETYTVTVNDKNTTFIMQ
jgi:hypothetical protein